MKNLKIRNFQDYLSISSDLFSRVNIMGNMTCDGEGSIILDDKHRSIKIKLPPGSYSIKLFKKQYEFLGKYKIILKPNNDEVFLTQSGNMAIIFFPSDSLYEVSILEPEVIEQGRIVEPYGYLYYFIIPNLGYYKIKTKNKSEKIEYKVSGEGISGTIYQIFPDRFYKYDNRGNFKNWDDLPDISSFYGGNLKGIIKKLPYLKDLGVRFIYLNPLFSSHSPHRYDVDDYFKIDKILGNFKDMRTLYLNCKRNNIRLILDMVFNHTSVHIKFFQDVIKKGKKSKYYDWYIFHDDKPSIFYGRCNYLKGETDCPKYETFMGYGLMPKLNLYNEDTVNYLLKVAKFWKDKVDPFAFRMDVGNSLPKEFIKKIKENIPEVKVIGEVWCDSPFFVSKNYYDGITNYPLRKIIVNYVKGKINGEEFINSYYEILYRLGDKINWSMNILDSHDTPRIIRTLGSLKLVKLAFLILFIMPGIPLIYYGDEIGLDGGRDPDCRRPFPWNNMNKDILNWFSNLIKIRNDNEIFYQGFPIYRKSKYCDIFLKTQDRRTLKLIISKKGTKVKEPGKIISGVNFKSDNGQIKLGKNGAVLIIS